MPKKITDPEEIARLDALAAEKAQESAPAPDPLAHYERMQQAIPVNPYRQAPPLPDEMWDAPPMRWAEGVLGMVPGAGEAASINPMGPPDTPVEQIAHGAGIATGIGGMLAAGGPLTAPLGEYVGGTVAATQYAPLAPMLANIAKTAPLFAGHGALEPGTPMERLEHAAGGANIAVEMAALGNIPGVRQAFSKPYTRVPAVGGYFTAKEVADGADPQESFFRNMGMAAGMEVGGALEQKPQSPRLQKTPAEMEAPPEVKPRAKSEKAEKPRFEYIEGEPRSVPVVDYLNGKIPYDKMAARYAEMDLRQPSDQLTRSAEAGEIRDLGENQTVGRHRRINEMANNRINSPLAKATTRQWELWDRAKNQMEVDMREDFRAILEKAGFKDGGSQNDFAALKEYMEAYPGMEAGTMSPADYAEYATKQADALARAENPAMIEQIAPKLRTELDRQWRAMDSMMQAVGGEMPRKVAYYPHIQKTNRIKAKLEPIAEKSPVPTRSPSAWTPREMPQTGAAKELELDPFRFMDRVIRDTGRKVAGTGAIASGQATAIALEAAGLNKTASGIRAITDAAYNKHRYGVAAQDARAETNPFGKAVVEGERFVKQRFNTAKYTIAVPFVLLRQWGSLGLLNAHGEITPAMWAKAVARATTPEAGKKYADSYTGWVKNLDYGHLSKEGATGDVTSAGSIRKKTGLAKLPDAIRAGSEKMVNVNENWTGRVSVEMADMISEKLVREGKMTEADREAFRSEVAGLTQSYYDAMNRPETLNSPTLNLLYPAQSFALEGFNSVTRDIIGNKQLTRAQKARRVGGLTAFMFLQQLINQYATSYKDDPKDLVADALVATPRSMIPYAPQLLGVAGIGKGEPYPATAWRDLKKAAKLADDGEWAEAFGEFAKNWIRGGAQMNRAISTDRRIEEGQLDESDRLRGSLFGWYDTESGKEYLRKIKGYDSDEGDNPNPRKRRSNNRRRRPRKGR